MAIDAGLQAVRSSSEAKDLMHTRSNRDTESGFSPQTPYLADVGVINLVPEPWGGPWMRRHQILTRLSQYFNIVWCNPAPSWRKIGRRTPPPNQEVNYQQVNYGGDVPPAFTIYQSLWLPVLGRPPFLTRWTTQQWLQPAQRLLHAGGCNKTILYIWRPKYEQHWIS